MKYSVVLDRRVERELNDLPVAIVQRLDKAIRSLAANPRPVKAKKLAGRQEEGWRLRVGDYRILYRVDDELQEVAIYRIGHRREVYRG